MSSRRYQTRSMYRSRPVSVQGGWRFAGFSRGHGLHQTRSSQFDGFSRGDGIVGSGATRGSLSDGGGRRRFVGVSRGHGAGSFEAFRRTQAGFSLMEIIIVTILIGGIVAFAASQILGGGDRANYRLAEAQLQTLAQKIDQYRMDTGRLPGALQDLLTQPSNTAGWLGPYAKASDLVDPWKNPLEYRVPGDGRPFDLVSLGADGAVGGQSVNADIRYE